MRRPIFPPARRDLYLRITSASCIAVALAFLTVQSEALGRRTTTDDPPRGSYRPGVVVVRFAEGRTPSGTGMNLRAGIFGDASLDNVLEGQRVRGITRMLPASAPAVSSSGRRLQRTFVVYYDEETDPSELAASFRELEDVEHAGVDRYIEVHYFSDTQSFPVDTEFPDQWNLHYYRDSVDVDMPEAWAIERGDPELILGVIDLGAMVDTSGSPWKTHSEFKHHYTIEDRSPFFTLSASDFDTTDSADDDQDDHKDNIFGVNCFPTYLAETNPFRASFWKGTPVNWARSSGWTISSYHTHGVKVAGIAAARARFSSTPQANIAGIANRCQVYFVSNAVNSSEVLQVEALTAVADFASVVNMSAGYCPIPDNDSDIYHAVAYAINDKDVVFVAGSGNYTAIGVSCDGEVPAPARWPGVLSVGSMDSTLLLYDDSVYGPEIDYVDIVAPVGDGIPAPSHTQCEAPLNPHPCEIFETVENFSGTSAAAPQVAGIAMLVRSRFPALDQEEVRERILRAAEFYWDDESNDDLKKYGAGKANAYRALTEWGVIEQNTTWGSVAGMPDTLYIAGDLTVAEGVTLTIHSGAVIRIAPDDIMVAGVDDQRIEINIEGELDVHGSVGEPVIIEAWDPQGTADWVGIYVSESSDSVLFQNCIIRNAEIAIDTYSPVRLRNVTIEDVGDAAVSVWGTTLRVDGLTIGASDADGIRLDDSAATIDSTTVNGYADYGLYMSGSAALNISKSVFVGGDVGVYVENNTTNGTISKTSFDCGIGLSYYNSTKPGINECVVTGNTTGIRLDHNSSPTILHCINSATYDGDITGNGVGIYCTDNSDPTVGHCNISSNNTGVGIFDSSEPDLDGHGANKFMSNSAYHVANLVGGTTVPATGNYWSTNTGSPNYYPNPARISGSVDYTSALSGAPNPVSPRPEPQPKPEVIITGLGRAHPNPFNPVVQLPYGVANPSDVRIDVYDVQGRLVRTLVNDHRERGNYVVVWDGTTAAGSPTASAVYFVQLRAGRVTETQKIVLLK